MNDAHQREQLKPRFLAVEVSYEERINEMYKSLRSQLFLANHEKNPFKYRGMD
jgi:hypothetical protein